MFFVPAAWLCNNSLERAHRSLRWSNQRISKTIPRSRIPFICRCTHCSCTHNHFLLWAQVRVACSPKIHILTNTLFAFRYGKKSMLWYIFVCSMIGGISVSVTTGLGAAIVQTALGDNQVRVDAQFQLALCIYHQCASSNTGSCIS